jgi:hypothetical protein
MLRTLPRHSWKKVRSIARTDSGHDLQTVDRHLGVGLARSFMRGAANGLCMPTDLAGTADI